METIILDNDIQVLFITASSFPQGIEQAHKELHARVPFSENRKYFGVSRPEDNGAIIYRAAAEELVPGEAEKYDCGTLVLKKGSYTSLTITHYRKDTEAIARAFDQLLSQRNLDPQGYCVEWYVNDHDVNCMVRLAD